MSLSEVLSAQEQREGDREALFQRETEGRHFHPEAGGKVERWAAPACLGSEAS